LPSNNMRGPTRLPGALQGKDAQQPDVGIGIRLAGLAARGDITHVALAKE
jgi:hypothetical protein